MKSALCVLAAVCSLGGASVCRGVVINFDDVASGTLVQNQYPGVTFTVEPGLGLQAYAFSYVGPSPYSSPNVLTCYDGGRSPTSVPDVYADFSPAVNGLSFLAVAADEFGVVARVNVYSGANLLGTDNIIGTGPTPGTFGYGSTTVNLSAYANVTRIEIIPPIGQTDLDSSYGGGGLIFDNFTFEAVPEPAVAPLLALSGMICAARRRRRR
jgi:hypothetical protein